MKFLGVEILQEIVAFFETIKSVITLEYLLYIFVGLEILTIVVFIVVTHYVYELRLIRVVDKLNSYLYQVQYIDESNLIEFNNIMKKVPKTLRYHWQQYMLYREKTPSSYMSIENCIDRPIKASAFDSLIKIVKILGFMYGLLAFVFSCGWATSLISIEPSYFIFISLIPLIILFLNSIFLIGLNARRASNTSDLYQTFHIFNRFIDKAVSTMPEYVDFEVLFTHKEIKRGIPVLNEYIEKRQIQEQEEMRKAKENAVQHELYNFGAAGEKGELVLERAMRETEILVNLKNRLNGEIEQLEKEIDSLKRSYENTSKDYQKKLQASKENVERLREQQEGTTNRIESNYIRKQQSDEIKKQEQIEKEQDAATLRFNQEINTLTSEIKNRKDEMELARQNAEKAMFSEYKTFANKIFIDVRDDVNSRVKEEHDKLRETREFIAKELEESLSKVESLEKQNKVLITKAGEREAYIRAKIRKEKEALLQKITEQEDIIKEKDQHISLISEDPNLKGFNKKIEKKPSFKGGKKGIIEGEFNFDDESSPKTEKKENIQDKSKSESNLETKADGVKGQFDEKGNYKFSNGTYYDADGYFHDENGNVYDPQGNIVNKKIAVQPRNILKELKVDRDVDDLEGVKKIEVLDIGDSFDIFDIDKEEKEIKDVKPIENIVDKIEDNMPTTVTNVKIDNSEEKVPETEKPANAEVKRPRGRPRKVVVEEDLKPKRPRGRPRKEVVEEDPKPKRPRGRPRKEVVEEDLKPKRPRGRPRKVVTEEEPKESKGSPKKIDIDDLKEIEKKIKEQNNILKGQHEELEKVVKKVTKK